MANEKNLINLRDRTPEERLAIQRKGAAATNAKLKRKKQMREAMQALLSLPVKSAKSRQKLIDLGIDPDDADNQYLVLASAFRSALKGDVRAMEFIRDVDRMDTDAERLKLEKKKMRIWEKELKAAKAAAAHQDADDPAVKQMEAVSEIVKQMMVPGDDEICK